MRRRKVIFVNLNQMKVLAKNVALVLLFLLAFFFMLINKTDNNVVGTANKVVLKTVAPVVHILTLPARGIYNSYMFFKNITRVYSENEKLKAENRFLLAEKNKYSSLRAENKLLSELLNYVAPEESKFITAKIVSEDSSGFSHSVIAYVGDSNEIKTGQIALSERGVVGRVEHVGGNYARIILVTDINSKIPVIVEKNRVRGILSGDNSRYPKLIFTPIGAELKEGDEIVTSGVAGVFPSGLPIGNIEKIDGLQIEVKPVVDLDRLEYIKIVDFDLSFETLD